ncbi:hypothetical protein BH11VER1_BH11VER1_41780 [soil metagenome]
MLSGAPTLLFSDQNATPFCFLRSRREPIFRILKITSAPFELTIQVEYGCATKGQETREMFTFGRDRFGRLMLQDRSV